LCRSIFLSKFCTCQATDALDSRASRGICGGCHPTWWEWKYVHLSFVSSHSKVRS
jgi:hypothetical protein